MIVAKGKVSAHPFARMVFSLAAKRFTGDLALTSSRRTYKWSLENGQVVAALSPSPADSPGRVALTHGLINSSALGRVVQELEGDPETDAIDVIGDIAKLSEEQRRNLRRRVLSRTAARLFALPDADFVVDNARTMKANASIPPLDMRWLIYFGLRTHYKLPRLERELSAVGNRGLTIAPKAIPMLGAFGFTKVEEPLLARLQGEAMSIPNLVATTPALDETTILCVAYALIACGYVVFGQEQAPPVSAPETKKMPIPGRAPRPTATPTRTRMPKEERVTVSGAHTLPDPIAPAKGAKETTNLIDTKLAALDQENDHFVLLGVSAKATDEEVRKAYFQLAKKLHPDRLHALGLIDCKDRAQRLFAAINHAFSVLSTPSRRTEYEKILAVGGEKAYRKSQHEAEQLALNSLAAEEHFHLGEMALRRDQFATAEKEFAKAQELAPKEGEYIAMYAWTMFCNAKDRAIAEPEALRLMSSALLLSSKSVLTHLHHAKLLKRLGRTEEAIPSYKKVLQLSPGHKEAALELRLLTQQRSKSETKGRGLFGRRK